MKKILLLTHQLLKAHRNYQNLKLTVIIFLIALSFNKALAQNTLKLDERNGFKTLIFETTLDEIKAKHKLKHIETDKKNKSSIYSLKDLHDYTILDVEPSSIYLFFFDNKLKQITVKMPDQPAFINGAPNSYRINLAFKT